MKLISPTLTYKQAYLKALEDSEGETSSTKLFSPDPEQSFEDFVQLLLDRAEGKNVPSHLVPSSTYWLIDNEEVIGRVHLRHTLNDSLKKEGGHLGYYIVPSKRNIGYGKKILKLGLEEAKKKGLKRVLLTCDEDNLASRKIIEANGGMLDHVEQATATSPALRHYWITL